MDGKREGRREGGGERECEGGKEGRKEGRKEGEKAHRYSRARAASFRLRSLTECRTTASTNGWTCASLGFGV